MLVILRIIKLLEVLWLYEGYELIGVLICMSIFKPHSFRMTGYFNHLEYKRAVQFNRHTGITQYSVIVGTLRHFHGAEIASITSFIGLKVY